MDITKAFIKAKQPCADGFRWYVRNARQESSYQEILDALVADGRINDACWLLDQFGPTDAVLTLDHVDADALIFAGTIHVRGTIEVATMLRAGRDIRAGGGIASGGSVIAGGDIKSGAALRAAEKLRAAGLIQAEWNVHSGSELECESLRAGWDLLSQGPARIAGDCSLGEGLTALQDFYCAKGLRTGGAIDAAQRLQTGHGIECGADLRAGGHLEAGWGIKARGDIHAEGSIRAGESLSAEGQIKAGDGYGVYAGVEVSEHAWESSARVHANRPPRELRSGWWAGPLPGLGLAF
ncbi:hypothetical protein [Bordetella avium]|uniref:DUF342 domain-containing protein n=1 Tax=Bordetella avium (strain 197N) TaxID=360910 RepID=Q2L0N7_BORA1|nr:hypothetical protein [Bordetella avium]AZY49210.1 hypothetical protein C0J09_08695 [Bordetella avium]AZY52564.1 hypothetical protein C0J07_08675 [Bordetella avium]RIQ48616.1 hypothetical protein D0843_15280 [Bordetella avium]RIQ71371.1 hypothetical protein D0838_11910 [Bordetella avium]CAJ49468.1 hypothetical protein BAV1859 [Bordetella avium 197N]